MVGLKTHGKLTLVVAAKVKRSSVMCIASGNYNPTTSCTYTDLSLFTANEEFAPTPVSFQLPDRCSRQTEYRQLIVAPVNLRERITALIDREIEHQKAAGRRACHQDEPSGRHRCYSKAVRGITRGGG